MQILAWDDVAVPVLAGNLLFTNHPFWKMPPVPIVLVLPLVVVPRAIFVVLHFVY